MAEAGAPLPAHAMHWLAGVHRALAVERLGRAMVGMVAKSLRAQQAPPAFFAFRQAAGGGWAPLIISPYVDTRHWYMDSRI